jgi:hypothetical protein
MIPPVGDRNAEIGAAVANPFKATFYCFNFPSVSMAICTVDCSKVFSGRLAALDRHYP